MVLYVSINNIATKNIDEYKSEFINLSKELEPAGEISRGLTFNFSFKKVNLPYDSYQGSMIFIKYKNTNLDIL